MNERERDFADAARAIEESLVFGVVRGAIALVGRPFQGRQLPALNGSACAIAAVVGVITHVILLQMIPDRVAPVKPIAYLMVVAFAAFVAVAGFITTRSSATAIADSSAGTANTRKS